MVFPFSCKILKTANYIDSFDFTVLCPCISVLLKAAYKSRLRVLEGRGVSAQKALQWFETMTMESERGIEEYNTLPDEAKSKLKKLVSVQTLRSSVDTMEQSSRSSATICCSRTDVLMLWPCKIQSKRD